MRRRPKAPSAGSSSRHLSSTRRTPIAFLGALVLAIIVAFGAASAIADVPPALTIDQPSSVTATSAHLSGTVDPQGGPSETFWRFEYSTDQSNWQPVGDLQSAGSGSGPVVVEADLEGLTPNSLYFIRLYAQNEDGANVSVTDPPETVQLFTEPAPPKVLHGPYTRLSATSVRLRGYVNPRNSEVFDCRFVYSADESFDQSVPCKEAPGSATTAQEVTADLKGLTPGATYNFHLIAANGGGEAIAPDATFTVSEQPGASEECPNEELRIGASADLPECRAYEMISPVHKNGGEVLPSPRKARVAINGESAVFSSLSSFAGALGTGLTVDYAAVRHDESWRTHAIMPRQEPQRGNTLFFNRSAYFQEFSPELTSGVLFAISPIGSAPNVESVNGIYLRSDVLSAGPGAWSLLNGATSPQIAPPDEEPFIAAATPDFRHFLFESKLNLLPEVPPCPNPAVFFTCTTKLYEWDHGTVRLAGILPNGNPATCPEFADHPCAGAGLGAATYVSRGALSSDGDRVFFSSPVSEAGIANNPDSRIYMREGHTTTVEVSATERTDCSGDPTCGGDAIPDPAPDPSGPAAAGYGGATPDGNRIFFTSKEQLTDAQGSGLYMYDATKPAAAPDNLTLLSIDQESVDGIGTLVHGVVGYSDDGSTVYYLAEGQLVAGAPTGNPQSRRIFAWRDGVTRYVGGLSPPGLGSDDDAADALGTSVIGLVKKTSRVTPDGRHLLFTSRHGDELGGYDHGLDGCGLSTGLNVPCSEVYVYDIEAGGGAGELMCASCNPTGASATSEASHQISVASGNARTTKYENRAISDDGRRVYFTSGEALVPEDDNGVKDVYLFDTETGKHHLISTGKHEVDSIFMDATPTGGDVLFVTRERLVGIDIDTSYDLYSARQGGGIAAQNPPAPELECSGDTCQGEQMGSSSTGPDPVSATIAGRGNLVERRPANRRCAKRKRRVVRKGKALCVKRDRTSSDRRTGR